MVTPTLKDFVCVDHDLIGTWKPSTDEVWYCLSLRIGTSGALGADVYQIEVGTPEGLKHVRRSAGWHRGITPIVVHPYSWEAVLEEVLRRIESCVDTTELRVQDALRTHFHWEYEGMEARR